MDDFLDISDFSTIFSSVQKSSSDTEEGIINILKKNRLNTTEHRIKDDVCKVCYTPMQCAAKMGRLEIVEALLGLDIDQELRGRDEDNNSKVKQNQKDKAKRNQAINKDNYTLCDEYLLLLAAEMGHDELLYFFKYGKRSVEAKGSSKTVTLLD